jgi:hypothetical protein
VLKLGLRGDSPGVRAENTFSEVPRYLDQLERRFAPSVAGVPPITAVVENLTTRFGGPRRIPRLRLVQQLQTVWRAFATLAYFDRLIAQGANLPPGIASLAALPGQVA